MRAKRAKQYRKSMNAYALSFGFRSPLQVLLDADIIRAASRYKMNLGNMLGNTLGGYEIKPMISQCCIRHLYNAPATTDVEKREKDGWIDVAKQAERRRCGHHELEEPLSALECVSSIVDGKENGTNKHRYVVASQDPEIRARMRSIAGVPLVYINRSVMIMEPLSTVTEQARRAEEKSKIRAGLKGGRGTESGSKRKRGADDDGSDVADSVDGTPLPKPKKMKGPKGPNPLSMKRPQSQKSREGQKASARRTEEGLAPMRNAEVRDGQTARKAEAATDKAAAVADKGNPDGPKKRKRKRKVTIAGVATVYDAEDDK